MNRCSSPEALQPLPLCLKQEMSPEVNSSSPSPNIIANAAFLELTSSSAPIANSCSNASHLSHGFSSFSHHAPLHGQLGSPPLIAGKASRIAHASLIAVARPSGVFGAVRLTDGWICFRQRCGELNAARLSSTHSLGRTDRLHLLHHHWDGSR